MCIYTLRFIFETVGNKLKKHRTLNKNQNTFLYIENYRYVYVMNLKIATEIGKCLSNKIRFQILEWLKEPEKHFPPHETLKHFNDGVCVTYIQEKTELSQSTILIDIFLVRFRIDNPCLCPNSNRKQKIFRL